jgi:CheY-like chemotaxis protein
LKQVFSEAYNYEFAENAEEAMELIEELEERDGEIRLIICDWLMPGKKGDEFLIDVHKHYPRIVKIMLTGQADEEAIEHAKKYANLHICLYKPWNDTELTYALKSCLESFV